ncbi:MAG: triose-phosphate isomerase [Candidatus Pacearchaeota archaeon]|nr:triose-phosphate isomerase [Candidatus Pacearchaeota archaeon]
MKPIVIVNLKTYNQGKKVIDLVRKISKVDKGVILGVQSVDLSEVVKVVKNPVYVQHVDFEEVGRNTGFVLPEAVKSRGAEGVFLNHSEHKLSFGVLKKSVERCREVKLKTAVFAGSLSEAKKIKKLKPDYLIIEPPKLVAGNVSVSEAKPELIERISKRLGYDFIVGAGIKSNNDLVIAMKLGAKGIAVSSAITKAKNPEKILREMISR